MQVEREGLVAAYIAEQHDVLRHSLVPSVTGSAVTKFCHKKGIDDRLAQIKDFYGSS